MSEYYAWARQTLSTCFDALPASWLLLIALELRIIQSVTLRITYVLSVVTLESSRRRPLWLTFLLRQVRLEEGKVSRKLRK